MTLLKNGLNAFGLFLGIASTAFAYHPAAFDKPLKRIAFGSCNRQDLPQPMWSTIAGNAPDLWIWLGDNLYADSRDPKVIREAYETQFNQPDYSAFRQTFPIIGTWDDHDYGEDNAGKDFPAKRVSRMEAMKFFEIPKGDPRKRRTGIYGDYTFGPEGQQVRVFLLDCRSFAQEPDPDSDLLGRYQWKWLEDGLIGSTAQVNIIATGIQFIPTEHAHEKWANYPKSRMRLLWTIYESQAENVVILSGDRHIHEISVLDSFRTRCPIVEITSSSLTHSWTSFPGEPNRYRHGDVYTQNGFGMLWIDWEATPVRIRGEIRNVDNAVVNEVLIPLKLAP